MSECIEFEDDGTVAYAGPMEGRLNARVTVDADGEMVVKIYSLYWDCECDPVDDEELRALRATVRSLAAFIRRR